MAAPAWGGGRCGGGSEGPEKSPSHLRTPLSSHRDDAQRLHAVAQDVHKRAAQVDGARVVVVVVVAVVGGSVGVGVGVGRVLGLAVPVIMGVAVVVVRPQNREHGHIDADARERGQAHHLAVHPLWLLEPTRRLDDEHGRHDVGEHGGRERAQDFDAVEPKRVAAARGSGFRAHARRHERGHQADGVGHHMGGVGDDGEGVRDQAAGELYADEEQGEDQRGRQPLLDRARRGVGRDAGGESAAGGRLAAVQEAGR